MTTIREIDMTDPLLWERLIKDLKKVAELHGCRDQAHGVASRLFETVRGCYGPGVDKAGVSFGITLFSLLVLLELVENRMIMFLPSRDAGEKKN